MNDLKDAIKTKNAVLFVGSGISSNLGLPTWTELINKMSVDLGFEPEIFKSFGGFLELAEYYNLKKGLGTLRSWMDREWHSPTIKIEDSEIHKLIVELDFPIIYTTNYDRWLELSYEKYGKDYVKISDVANLTELNQNKTQIIKFHGDFYSSDDSIVLSESSYFERLDFETPLDIKLRADALGKTLLFIGYSLSDINIRYMLFKLNKLWEKSKNKYAKPKSYIFLPSPNPVQELILEQRGVTPIISDYDNIKEGLIEFLKKIK